MYVDMKLETLYACIVAAIVIIFAYLYITSEYYYINHVLRTAFHELKDGDSVRALNPRVTAG